MWGGVLLLFVEVLAAPGSFPPTTIATTPAVALLDTTVVLINKHLTCAYFRVNLGAFCGKL